MDSEPIVDFFGKLIKENQLVVYPGRQSSNLWLNYGVVVNVDLDKQSLSIRKLGIDAEYEYNTVDGSWQSGAKKYKNKYKLYPKIVTITNTNLVVVIDNTNSIHNLYVRDVLFNGATHEIETLPEEIYSERRPYSYRK